jgi:carbon storage regulator CsrA
MLVLSRKPTQRLVFPTLNTAIQVLEIRRGMVRLGIEAPPDVTVLREEVLARPAERIPEPPRAPEPTPDRGITEAFGRQLCDRLKTTGMGLGLLRLQLEAGLTEEAQQTLAQIQEDFQILRYGAEGEIAGPAVPPPAKPSRLRKALLVEDDRNERELLAGFLRQSGLNVDTAGDGSDALDYLGRHARPDVVLLDMGLPRVDGPTTVREIRRNPALTGIRIFGVTGHLPEEFGLELGPRGIDGWFQKPLDPMALLQQLNEELEAPLATV